jgi:hypothetical protein
MESYYHTYVTFSRGTAAIAELNGPFDLLSVVERWAGIAAAGRVRVVDFDDLRGSAEPLWARFLELALGRPWAGPTISMAAAENVSLPPMTLVLCRELRKSGASEDQIAMFIAAVSRIRPVERQALLDGDTAARLDALYAAELERLRASPLVDGFFPSAPAVPPAHGIVIDDMASALSAMIRACTVTKA